MYKFKVYIYIYMSFIVNRSVWLYLVEKKNAVEMQDIV